MLLQIMGYWTASSRISHYELVKLAVSTSAAQVFSLKTAARGVASNIVSMVYESHG